MIEQFQDKDPSRIIQSRFSQGAMILQATLIKHKIDKPLKGIIALNGQ